MKTIKITRRSKIFGFGWSIDGSEPTPKYVGTMKIINDAIKADKSYYSAVKKLSYRGKWFLKVDKKWIEIDGSLAIDIFKIFHGQKGSVEAEIEIN